ncbi:hypothetical protein OIE66_10450 [Nonomuraea sp. NBC_01738]|uniref:DUF6879 family protein n=1 Tax=Nonomuraea sp. NBC_01738 TaxID=2976003 RepID=UPI002E15B996|nr:DUF6879 family protein [Nonomuraea sp. NBC_01738]WSG17294.1 hypothetical protein OIE66_10450 [Nonomuraea sp. NBC_01738]
MRTGYRSPGQPPDLATTGPGFGELLAAAAYSAVQLHGDDTDACRTDVWAALVAQAVTRGVVVRRVRVVPGPGSARGEPIVPGEQVRWLPRSLTSTLPLPGNPFWLFDDRMVRFSVFGGDGLWRCWQFTSDREVVALCATAFESAWSWAVPRD